MELTLQSPARPAGSVIEALQAEGVSYDIRMGLDLQEVQRKAGVPVLPLRVICGLDAPQRRNNQIGNARVLAARPSRAGVKVGSTSRATKCGRTASRRGAMRKPNLPRR
jgi:hypothetical protein